MSIEFERFITAARAQRGGFFDASRPITAARAPGWVDLLGGVAAHAGALALGWPLGASAFVALQPDPAPAIVVQDEQGHDTSLPLTELIAADGRPRAYGEAAQRLAPRDLLQRLVGAAWLALLREEFAHLPGGARLLLRWRSGPGWPVSVVAAVAQALVSAFGVRLAPRELGLACQTALGRVVQPGSAIGALGPLVSVCAHADALLLLHPQPAWMWGNLHLPTGTTIWALRVGDGPGSGARATSGAAEAIAYRIAAEAEELDPGEADARWLGYLANIGSDRLARQLRDLLPATVSGQAYLARYGQPPGLKLDAGQHYPARAAAVLAVEEHLRARLAVALLRAAASKAQRDDDLALVGELMALSHWAQRAAGHGDAHADQLVDRVYAAGMSQGLYGARAPSAESGATLVVLGRAEAEPALQAIAAGYAAEHGLPVAISGGSAAGCSPAGTREL
ncbi:MAG: hypothetical protein HXY37_10595 [Chloroflexi bacterium]|nr:hypothetical protein [Chloroflexota bacterium]